MVTPKCESKAWFIAMQLYCLTLQKKLLLTLTNESQPFLPYVYIILTQTEINQSVMNKP